MHIFERLDILLDVRVVENDLAVALREVRMRHIGKNRLMAWGMILCAIWTIQFIIAFSLMMNKRERKKERKREKEKEEGGEY